MIFDTNHCVLKGLNNQYRLTYLHPDPCKSNETKTDVLGKNELRFVKYGDE